MRTVRYRGRKGYEEHFLYTVEEADELGIPYIKDWRTFERKGQWVMTDDQMVVEVISCGKMRTGTLWLRTATGSFLASSGSLLDVTHRDSRYTFNGIKKDQQPFRLTERMRQWICLFSNGQHPIESYLMVFNGSSREHAEKRVFFLLKQEEVKEAVREELRSVLKRLDIDESYVLTHMKELVEGEGVNDNVRLKCLSELADIIELKPKNEQPLGGFLGFGTVIDAVEEGKVLGGNPAADRLAEGQQAIATAETLEEADNEQE